MVHEGILTLDRPRKGEGGGFKWTPHSFFRPTNESFEAIKMKLSVPVVQLQTFIGRRHHL